MLFASFQPDDLLSAKIQSLCPTISGNICCTEAQFDTLRTQVQQVTCFPSFINYKPKKKKFTMYSLMLCTFYS